MVTGWLKKAFSSATQEPWEQDRDDFFKAIRKNNADKIREIAGRYPNEALDWKTEKGTPLFVAHANGCFDAFKTLVALGADINENYTLGKGKGHSPLLRAIVRNEKDMLEFMLDNGADLNKVTERVSIEAGMAFYYTYTPISVAIEKGNDQAVKLLLAKGVDPKAPCYGADMMKTAVLCVSPAKHAENNKNYKLADSIKRAALQGPVSVATAPSPPIGVMQPLKLKKGAASPVGTP